MTVRAILWCGALLSRPTLWAIDGPQSLPGDPYDPTHDFVAQVNGLALAFLAARAHGAEPRDIHACVCRDDLLPQEFAPPHHPATVEALQQLTRALAHQAKEDDALLFIATNHGRKPGLLTSATSDEFDDAQPLLTPAALDACLATLPGRQAVIIAACYAGQFLPLGARPDRVVLASCGADEIYKIRKEEGACSAFLAQLFAAWCGVGLSDDIPRDRLSLDDAFARATQRLTAASAPNQPARAGTATW